MPTSAPRTARRSRSAGDGFAIVAASERFPLASLMLSDMRAVLRELARRGRGGGRRAAPRAA